MKWSVAVSPVRAISAAIGPWYQVESNPVIPVPTRSQVAERAAVAARITDADAKATSARGAGSPRFGRSPEASAAGGIARRTTNEPSASPKITVQAEKSPGSPVRIETTTSEATAATVAARTSGAPLQPGARRLARAVPSRPAVNTTAARVTSAPRYPARLRPPS